MQSYLNAKQQQIQQEEGGNSLQTTNSDSTITIETQLEGGETVNAPPAYASLQTEVSNQQQTQDNLNQSV